MCYFYTVPREPNLDILELAIVAIDVLANKYSFLRWDKEDELLKVMMSEELSLVEKAALDTAVTLYLLQV